MRQSSATPARLLLVAALMAGCQQTEQPTRKLVLSGSRTMAPLLRDLARLYEEDHPDVRIYVEPAGADQGVADTRAGLADVGMLGRALRPDESGLNDYLIARDGVVFIVHRHNPIAELTPAQLGALFNGLSSNWKDVGGRDSPVELVRPADGMALRAVFLRHFGLPVNQPSTAPGVGSCERIIRAVAKHRHAIGYASLGCVEEMLEHDGELGEQIRLLPLRGVPPTLEQVEKGRYPFTRPLLLLTRRSPREPVVDFINFIRSDRKVRNRIANHHFVPIISPKGPGQ